jgi:hypothetical protein
VAHRRAGHPARALERAAERLTVRRSRIAGNGPLTQA